MKRRMLGCFALWMLTTPVLAQSPAANNAQRPATSRPAPSVARPAVTPVRQVRAEPAAVTPAPEPTQLRSQPAPVETQAPVPQISPEAMTPELYLYLQDQKRHDDPSQAVRRKAEFKASQRMNRMATMKWFGMSNARPQAAAVPMMGVYSPAWIGNGYDRYDWVGGAYPSATIYVESETVQR